MSTNAPTAENPVASVLCKLRDGTLAYVPVEQLALPVQPAAPTPKRKAVKNG